MSERASVASETLVIGGRGYVGRAVARALLRDGASVTTTSRWAGPEGPIEVSNGPALDELLAARRYHQIVHLPQLTAPGEDWALDRIDGPRWLVFSSSQLSSRIPAAGTELALAREATALSRGATILRPTMIFGKAGDHNISRVIRFLRRYRTPVVIGDGDQLLQPVHVDDVSALVVAHRRLPRPGRFEVGGDQPISALDLMVELGRSLGLRRPPVRVPEVCVGTIAKLRVPGFRPDQLVRLREDKVVDNEPARQAYAWSPAPLRDRLGQAVGEALESWPPRTAST